MEEKYPFWQKANGTKQKRQSYNQQTNGSSGLGYEVPLSCTKRRNTETMSRTADSLCVTQRILEFSKDR